MEKFGYTVKEAVTSSGIGRSKLYELMRAGELKSIKIGKRRIIPADALRDLLNDSQRAA